MLMLCLVFMFNVNFEIKFFRLYEYYDKKIKSALFYFLYLTEGPPNIQPRAPQKVNPAVDQRLKQSDAFS